MAQQIVQYILYISLALIPSIIWLLFYLRKDKHPEPNSMVIQIFIWGMLIAFPAVIIENFAISLLDSFNLSGTIQLSLLYFVGVAATEEALKFLVVYFRVIKRTTEIDEPIDAMLYMIISALGFAAIENVFLLTPMFIDNFSATINVAFSRFLGATFLHALASAIIGYYLALSFFKPHKKVFLLIHGFSLAILLHGFYNIFVINLEGNFIFVLPTAALIIFSAVTISSFIKKISQMKSITQISQ